MDKNEIIIGCAEALGTSGEGIVKQDGMTVFVPYLLPGERAKIKILQVKGSIAYGRALEIFTPAEERVRPVCPVFGRCGGCQLQHLRYVDQLRFKTAVVREALRKIGGIVTDVSPCEKSEKEFSYRNKLQLPIGKVGGENVLGFYAARSHRIVPVKNCPIHPKWTEKLIAAVEAFMKNNRVDGFDEMTLEGTLRHIVVREIKKKYIVTLVSAKKTVPHIEEFAKLLDKVFPEYSLYVNFHPENNNVIFGEEFTLVKGAGSYEGEECGIRYEAGANTFLQVNEWVRKKLYEEAVSLTSEEDTVIDCYAGGGLLTAMFAKKCKKAYGIEIVPEASACADALKEKNGLDGKMENLCGAVEELLPPLLEREKDAVVLLDPPRAGLGKGVVEAVKAANAERVILISCNPATLARDLGLFTGSLKKNEKGELLKAEGGDYEIELVRPFDMFPQTKHVETLVALKKRRAGGDDQIDKNF